MTTRSPLRRPEFDALVRRLAGQVENAEIIIDGACWWIARNPESGIHLSEYDIWYATLVIPPVILMYTVYPRYVHMLTMIASDDTLTL